MATNLTGTINITFGKFSQNETFYVTRAAGNDYVAGSGRGLVGTGLLPAAGLTNEGLLLITNDNTIGDLGVSMDGTAYDVVIPPAVSNLISIGPDHAVKVRTAIATATSQGLASATATTVTFDGAQRLWQMFLMSTGVQQLIYLAQLVVVIVLSRLLTLQSIAML